MLWTERADPAATAAQLLPLLGVKQAAAAAAAGAAAAV
jgi:hypothetical protein